MTTIDRPRTTGLTEHLMFAALLIPTFLVIAAAAVSLAIPDPSVAVPVAQTVAACEPCAPENGE
ncbi:MAG TPA: hypothetical protein VFJ70_10210 [Burkholderiales bacterium]|nr:hypothetical protein [Burkholderiales bacterium]